MHQKYLVVIGGCGLALGAAFTNTSLVLHTETSVSHLTGDIAKLSIHLASWAPETMTEALYVGAAAFCFLLGAMLSGAVIHHPTLNFERPYGRSILGIGCLLLISAMVLETLPLIGIGLAAFGCGLQNALAAHYRGLILRTTHLTGMFTDLGVMLGMRLRGHNIPAWKIVIPAAIMASFFLGGLAAALLYFAGIDPLYVVSVAYIISSLTWSLFKHQLPATKPLPEPPKP